MKIGFDAKRAFYNQTGLGNYSRTLISDLHTYYPDEDYYFFTPGFNPKYEAISAHGTVVSPQHNNPVWRSLGIQKEIKNKNLDVFHGLSNELPFKINKTGIPSVVTIHDVIFDIIKGDFPLSDRIMYRIKTQKCIRDASKIIAISQRTKQDLIERFDAPEEKIEVIYQPHDRQFNNAPMNQQAVLRTRQQHNLPDHFILYVGAIMNRKNILRLVKAWEQLEKKIPLLIFGGGNRYRKKIENYILKKNIGEWVQLREPVDFDQLPELYKMAETVVYPSLYEGFGLPVLEALACGARVVTSNVSSMPEAGGSLPIYISPDDVESIAAGIEQSLHAPPPDDIKLSSHLACFNRAKVAEQMMRLYAEVAGK